MHTILTQSFGPLATLSLRRRWSKRAARRPQDDRDTTASALSTRSNNKSAGVHNAATTGTGLARAVWQEAPSPSISESCGWWQKLHKFPSGHPPSVKCLRQGLQRPSAWFFEPREMMVTTFTCLIRVPRGLLFRWRSPRTSRRSAFCLGGAGNFISDPGSLLNVAWGATTVTPQAPDSG